MKQTEAEQELSSQEVERFARSVFGELPQGVEIPGTENLADKIAQARKRVNDIASSASEGSDCSR